MDLYSENLRRKYPNLEKSIYFELAGFYFEAKDYITAMTMIASFLANQPDSPHGNFLSGKISAALGMTEEAITAFEKAYDQGLEKDSVLEICRNACNLPRSVINRQIQVNWFHKGQAMEPHHLAVTQLREVLRCHLFLSENLKHELENQTLAILEEMFSKLMKHADSSSRDIKREMQEIAFQNFSLTEKPTATASAAFLGWTQQYLENNFPISMDE